MGYYKNKVKAYRLIDELISQNVSLNVVTFKVQTVFGFSEKFVKERIDLIKGISEENEDKFIKEV